VTFRTISMLLSTEPAGGCYLLDDFLLAPLPAHKRLWKSSNNETQWMLGKSRDFEAASVFGIKTSGQMVKLGGRVAVMESSEILSAHPKELDERESSANWQDWCSGMDELGALIMLAASLPM
jgi:hypothetical protein